LLDFFVKNKSSNPLSLLQFSTPELVRCTKTCNKRPEIICVTLFLFPRGRPTLAITLNLDGTTHSVGMGVVLAHEMGHILGRFQQIRKKTNCLKGPKHENLHLEFLTTIKAYRGGH
jgi:hypothetical protein